MQLTATAGSHIVSNKEKGMYYFPYQPPSPDGKYYPPPPELVVALFVALGIAVLVYFLLSTIIALPEGWRTGIAIIVFIVVFIVGIFVIGNCAESAKEEDKQ